MLSFATPEALWLLLAILPVTVLHLLRRRFRRSPSGSNWIWNRLATEAKGMRRPRIRSLLLLFLQILAVAAGALAAAGPTWIDRHVYGRGLAVLVDLSESMGREDMDDEAGNTVTRVEAAIALAKQEIEALPSGAPVAVFGCASELRPLAAPLGKAGALGALGRLRAGDEAFRESRVAEELSAWLSLRKEPWRFILYTDGGLDLGGSVLAKALRNSVEFRVLGRDGGGIGFADLRLAAVGAAGKASCRAWNGTEAPVSVEAALSRDGVELLRRTLVLPPGWSRQELAPAKGEAKGLWRLEGRVGEGSSRGAARVRGTALVVGAARSGEVLVVGPRDPWILSALEAAGARVSRLADFPPTGLRGYDLVVAEGLRSPAGIEAPLLSLGAIPEGAPLTPGPLAMGALSSIGDHRLGRFADWDGSSVAESLSVSAGEGVTPLAEAGGRVVAATWNEGGYPRVFVGFPPRSADLGLSASWPLFIGNVLDLAAPREDAQREWTLEAGEIAQRAWPKDIAFAGDGAPSVTGAGRLVAVRGLRAGVFRWSGGGGTGLVAVNPPSDELDARPRAIPIAGERDSALTRVATRRADLGLLPLGLLGVFLLAEWFLWRGRPAKPKPSSRRIGKNRGETLVRVASILRGSALALVILAGFGLLLPLPSRSRSLGFLIDASTSLGPESVEAERRAAISLAAGLEGSDRISVFSFAGGVRALGGPWSPAEAAARLGALELTAPDPEETDIEAAIALGARVGEDRRSASSALVLFSDFRATKGGGLTALASGSPPIHALPFPGQGGAIRSRGITGPTTARPGQLVEFAWHLESKSYVELDWELVVDGKAGPPTRSALRGGGTTLAARLDAGSSGSRLVEFRAVDETGAPIPSLDEGAALVVEGGPTTLVVSAEEGGPSPLAAALGAQGIETRSGGPSILPDRALGYVGLRAAILDDLPALALAPSQQAALENFASSGGGVLFVGGPRSFGRGEYYATPLEDMLPVRSDTRRRLFLTRTRILFLIDHSASMTQKVEGESKQEAAMRGVAAAIERLESYDEVGIVSFDSTPAWVLPFTPVSKLRDVNSAIASIPQGGGTDLGAAIEAGIAGFGPPGPTRRHMVALTDGFTITTDWEALASSLRASDISLSTIAVGAQVNEDLLRGLASATEGAYWRTEGSRIPELLNQETIRLTRDLMREGRFEVRLDKEGGPALGLPPLPPVAGYLAVEPKSLATVWLSVADPQTPNGAPPLLATWNWGSGRVAAFLSDSGSRWLAEWRGRPIYNRLWAQLLRFVEAPRPSESIGARAEVAGGELEIVAEARSPDRGSLSGLRPVARDLDSTLPPVPLSEEGPGSYRGALPIEGKGLHRISIRDEGGAETSTFVWLKASRESAASGADSVLAARLASLSGGTLLDPSHPRLPSPGLGLRWQESRPWFAALALLLLSVELLLRSALMGHFAAAAGALLSWFDQRAKEARFLLSKPYMGVAGMDEPKRRRR